VNKVIEPLGETRSDLMIVQGLAELLGLKKEMEGTHREWLERIFRPMEQAGLSVERVMAGPLRCPVAPPVAFEDRKFRTPSGRFEFTDRIYDVVPGAYPFRLLTVLSKKWLNSLILESEHPDLPVAVIHPDVAAERGLSDNSRARLSSLRGELTVVVRVSDDTRSDTIVLPQGTWIKRGGGVNQLTEGLISTAGQMAAYNDTTVTIEPI
jgi:anaerobic selenocysteine-containing dehydrogenase